MDCQLCGRGEFPDELMEKHHLLPQARSKRYGISRVENNKNTIWVCKACGTQVHKLFDLNELAKSYNTLDKLLGSPEIQKWIRWVRRRPVTTKICMKPKKRRR